MDSEWPGALCSQVIRPAGATVLFFFLSFKRLNDIYVITQHLLWPYIYSDFLFLIYKEKAITFLGTNSVIYVELCVRLCVWRRESERERKRERENQSHWSPMPIHVNTADIHLDPTDRSDTLLRFCAALDTRACFACPTCPERTDLISCLGGLTITTCPCFSLSLKLQPDPN